MWAIAYFILQRSIIARHGPDSTLAQAIGKDVKGKLPILLYALAIGGAFIHEWIALGIFIFIALMWLVPDRRIEKVLAKE